MTFPSFLAFPKGGKKELGKKRGGREQDEVGREEGKKGEK